MITNIIFILVGVILVFILYLAVKAIDRGIEAKNDLKSEKLLSENENSVYDEITKLKKLLDDGLISEEEFTKAKDKILK